MSSLRVNVRPVGMHGAGCRCDEQEVADQTPMTEWFERPQPRAAGAQSADQVEAYLTPPPPTDSEVRFAGAREDSDEIPAQLPMTEWFVREGAR
jgi:hypothetical protein